MENQTREKVYKEKALFVKAVLMALSADPQSQVCDVVYNYNPYDGFEMITIYFWGGSKTTINTTFNSNGANFLEIGRAVYGEGAVGEITEGKK